MFLPRPWPSSQMIDHMPMNHFIITHLVISLSREMEQPGALLSVLSTGKISLYHCYLGVSRKGPLMLPLSTFRWWLSIVQNHQWPRLVFSSSASRWGFRCMLMSRRRCRKSGDHRHLGYSCMLLIFVFRACSVLTTDIPLRIWWWSAIVHTQLLRLDVSVTT